MIKYERLLNQISVSKMTHFVSRIININFFTTKKPCISKYIYVCWSNMNRKSVSKMTHFVSRIFNFR